MKTYLVGLIALVGLLVPSLVQAEDVFYEQKEATNLEIKDLEFDQWDKAVECWGTNSVEVGNTEFKSGSDVAMRTDDGTIRLKNGFKAEAGSQLTVSSDVTDPNVVRSREKCPVRFKQFIQALEQLEQYYTPKEVVGIVFGVYEPEGDWNPMAPETSVYRPSAGEPLPPLAGICGANLESEKCRVTHDALRELIRIAKCDEGEGCHGQTASLFTLPQLATPINAGHVFAGLSEDLFPKIEWWVQFGTEILTANFGLNLFDRVKHDPSARSYIGDIGVSLVKAIRGSDFDDLDEVAQLRTVKRVYREGMRDKYDVHADVDSLVLRNNMVRLGSSYPVSELLDEYYRQKKDERGYVDRFAIFLASEFDVLDASRETPSNEIYEDMADKVEAFALVYQAAHHHNVLLGSIDEFAVEMVDLMYRDIGCEAGVQVYCQ